ncbi:MAG: tetratricopeptide repeat protein [Planctomycetota bacterium]
MTRRLSGASEEAASRYVESLRVKDNQPDIHMKLGDILYRQKKFNEAVKHWGESLKFNPKEPYAIHNRLGSAFYRLGKVDEAVKNWGRSLELKPEQPDIRNNIAMVLAQQKAGDKR